MDQAGIIALLTAWSAFCVGAASPGPNMIAVASLALSSGRGAALTMAAGIALGALGWVVATTYGLAVLFEAYPWTIKAMAIAGGGYLVYLGLKSLNAARTGATKIAPGQMDITDGQAFRRGIIVTWTNPKVAAFWASVSTIVTAATSSPTAMVVFTVVTALLAFLIYGAYGLLFSSAPARRVYQRGERVIETCFGAIFIAIGARLMLR